MRYFGTFMSCLAVVGLSSAALAAEPAPKAPQSTIPASDDPGYVRIAQTLLQQMGRYKGPLNGEMSPELVKAVMQFQDAMGIPPDGHVDRLLVNLLVDAGRPGYAPQ